MSSPRGFRQGYPNVIDAIRDTLADTNNAGSLSADDFNKLATVPAGMGLASAFFSGIIDLTAAAADYEVIPPCPFRLHSSQIQWQLVAVNACTVGPTTQAGSNAAVFNNLKASSVDAGFTSQVANTRVALAQISAGGVPYIDLSASGLRVAITNPATATVLTARFVCFGGVVPV